MHMYMHDYAQSRSRLKISNTLGGVLLVFMVETRVRSQREVLL